MPFVTIPIDGGLDLVTPPVSVSPGRLQACKNFEVALNQGIKTVDGFERFDGGSSPSSAVRLWLCDVNSLDTDKHDKLENGYFLGGEIGIGYDLNGEFVRSVIGRIVYTSVQSATLGKIYFVTTTEADSSALLNCLTSGSGYTFSNATSVLVQILIAGVYDSYIFMYSDIEANAVIGTVAETLAAQATYYTIVRAEVQEVPGQNSINGLFWLKDCLYACRDYETLSYTTQVSEALAGDELYIGASYATATWKGFLAKQVIEDADATTGDTDGIMMFYDTTGTATAATIYNHTRSDAAVATVVTVGAASQGAGLYKAVGTRGNTVATQSWEHQDIGWRIRYKDGVENFVPANRAAPLTDYADLIETTDWFVADAQVSTGGWGPFPGGGPTSIFDALSSIDEDGSYACKGFADNVTSNAFWIKDFGITDADIPDGSAITGFTIELTRRAYRGPSAVAGSQIQDGFLELKWAADSNVGGVASFADTTTNWLASASNPDNAYPPYVVKSYGGEQSLLGYTNVTPDDVKSTDFGFRMSAKCTGYSPPASPSNDGANSISAHVSSVRIRVHFVPPQSKVYFWNVNDPAPTAVVADVVQSYLTSGTVAGMDAKGHLFLMADTPSRAVGADEQIRTYPLPGVTPAGPGDGSVLIAMTENSLTKNVMDWSSLLNNQGSDPGANKYQYDTGNFTAVAGFEAIYGVSGCGPAFMYDGYAFTRMYTGIGAEDEDTPRHVRVHQGRLFLGYESGTIVFSDANNPLSYDAAIGTAGFIPITSPIRGLMKLNGDTLAQMTQTGVTMIQGDVSKGPYAGDISPDVGCVEYTAQNMGQYMYTSFRGIQNLRATQAYGDFDTSQFSWDVWSWLRPRVQTYAFFQSANIGVINSLAVRNKSQYRLMFADGYQLTATFLREGEMPQFTIQYYVHADGTTPHTWDVVTAGVESNGRDRLFGATNDGTGYVYEIDSGKSFDGANIEGFATLVIDDQRLPEQDKRYSDITIHGIAQGYATFNVSRSVNYAAVDTAQNYPEVFGSLTAAPTGDEAYFASSSPLRIAGRNVSIRFDFSHNDQYPMTLQAVSYYVIPQGEKRS